MNKKLTKQDFTQEMMEHFKSNGIVITSTKKQVRRPEGARTLTVKVIEGMTNFITLNLQQGNAVNISGLGTFKTTKLKERTLRMPNGQKVVAKGKTKVQFKPSKIIQDKLNQTNK